MSKNKKLKVPHTYTLIMMFIVTSVLLTYLIPAGVYNLIPGERMIDPASFHFSLFPQG